MFKRAAGIFAVHIPYNGGNPAQLALLSGQVDFNFDNLATAAANIKAGRLKALAVTTAQRSNALPDIPSMSETLKDFEIDTWWGLVAPAATPRDVVDRLNKAFVTALQTPETKTRFAQLMAEPVGNTPEQFATFMKKELTRYESVVKASGARVDCSSIHSRLFAVIPDLFRYPCPRTSSRDRPRIKSRVTLGCQR
jgi:tripartite-type tricarboxylate transporter receptor subunit TctC